MSRHGPKDCLDLPCLLALINAYKSLQDEPCQSCHRLLHQETLQLPALRVYQSPDAQASEGVWYPYHTECYVLASNDASQAFNP
ncbi:hypothetical protein P389DRAFT_40995 [Cystobasidium minutum MCA 4210]|uniref:uncharacterized protein n=1 Tax=Cystobasidium minutum MCA 4210 TaxID=1397322 RepID=UPI0034CDE668|eukprot:jgi/Rhomi1/40995/CE40994_124